MVQTTGPKSVNLTALDMSTNPLVIATNTAVQESATTVSALPKPGDA